MIYVFCLIILMTVTLLSVSGKMYNAEIKDLNKSHFKLKRFLGAGLLLVDLSRCSFRSWYSRRLQSKLIELWGHGNVYADIRLYWATKIIIIAAAIIFTSFLSTLVKLDEAFLIFTLALIAGAVVMPDKELDKKLKERRRSIQMDFPDFLMKLTLLINAGMTISNAWGKVSLESRNDSPLYMELQSSMKEIRGGSSEYKAFENFARRCRVPIVTRTMSILMQNLRKGNSELVSIMRVLSVECWENRKNAAKRLGEEAAAKMLLPLVMMFISVLLIVAAPAVLTLNGF